jgi:hypothetical protein
MLYRSGTGSWRSSLLRRSSRCLLNGTCSDERLHCSNPCLSWPTFHGTLIASLSAAYACMNESCSCARGVRQDYQLKLVDTIRATLDSKKSISYAAEFFMWRRARNIVCTDKIYALFHLGQIIFAAVVTVTSKMLHHIWDEMEHYFNVCWATKSAHFKTK